MSEQEVKIQPDQQMSAASSPVGEPPSATDQLAAGEAERDRLLWATKKQVKQIMEEAVTRKFVHEDSSSLISLCVAIDACLSHGLKRRVLGLFKTSSSMALLHKVAKDFPLGKDILELVQLEEGRLQEQQQRQRKRFSASSGGSRPQADSGSVARSLKWPLRSQTAQQQDSQAALVHKRNLWLKLALIENKLVQVVEYLAENANKYYKQEALMANYVIARVLSALLVGPSALKYKRCGQLNEIHYEDPTAHDLISRHKLANPIACLCEQTHSEPPEAEIVKATTCRGAESADASNLDDNDNVEATSGGRRSASPRDCDQAPRKSDLQAAKRRPLSLKGSTNGGILITNCHHYSCQEISEHQQTRGYSLRSASHSTPSSATALAPPNGFSNSPFSGALDSSSSSSRGGGANLRQADDHQQQQQVHLQMDGPVWSPRILHDILHQNSRSNLLYAKNNVLLETQSHQTIAGYLSLHQVGFSDLILKWIPNQMINGTQHHPMPTDCCDSDNDSHNDSHHSYSAAGLPVNVADTKHSQTNAVESSYLELVVSMPISKIVLLHCQFNRVDDSFHFNYNGQEKKPSGHIEPGADQQLASNNTEETVILVETDGVQMAPFRFPKGGLRSFLSCLQAGLAPDRYLDPAIQFDDSLTEQRSPFCYNISNDLQDPCGNLESPQCSSTGPTSQSRFDSLVRRLPSLKRRDNNNNNNSGDTKPGDSKSVASAPVGLNFDKALPKVSYVYRIVSISQPKESMLSDEASSVGLESSSAKKQQATNDDVRSRSESVSQRFRWSLSRMARFSSMYSNSSNGSNVASTTTTDVVSISGQLPDDEDNNNNNKNKNNSRTNERQQSLETVSLCDQPGDSLDVCSEEQAGLDLATGGSRASQTIELSKSLRDFSKIEAKLSELKESTSDEVLQTFRTQSIQTLCESMRKQITARAFYGWLSYCRKAKIVRTHLSHMIRPDAATYLRLLTISDEDDDVDVDEEIDYDDDNDDQTYERMRAIIRRLRSLDTQAIALSGKRNAGCFSQDQWDWLMANKKELGDEQLLANTFGWLVYLNGIENNELRKRVWPYLLGHYKFSASSNGHVANRKRDKTARKLYAACQRDWTKVERVVMQRDEEILTANMARARQLIGPSEAETKVQASPEATSAAELGALEAADAKQLPPTTTLDSLKRHANKDLSALQIEEPSTLDEAKLESTRAGPARVSNQETDSCVTNNGDVNIPPEAEATTTIARPTRPTRRHRLDSTGSLDSNASLTDKFGNNVHRIDKDVQRCDRNYHYFKASDNLDKLRRVMCTYVWQHLEVGYVQGMCDLAAPFLVIFDEDEIMAHNCFSKLMDRMVANFPHGTAMDRHFESLRYLIQVLDPKLFEVLQRNGDYSYFYFCYRWLLLDFKRELAYDDVFMVWETIWAARFVVTEHFVVFVALAMVRYYRNIIIENNMDFTDTIKFFNEMAEKHDAKKITALARESIVELHNLIKTWS